MRSAYEIIQDKKCGLELSPSDISAFVASYTQGDVSDAQMSAFMMAVCLCGMNDSETASLTRAMADTGSVVDTSSFPLLLDKHSTGGVGDKTSFLVASMLNAAGFTVGMMSGRGLGHTGGTLDKLESITGFNSNVDPDRYLELLANPGIAIISQTDGLAPADKKMYALRNETATIDSIPLIAASIVSKKIASGTRNIVFDVKWGSAAFMKIEEDAQALADSMVGICRNCGMRATARLTPSFDVLGRAAGNAIEIQECLDIMGGKWDSRSEGLIDLSVDLATRAASLVADADGVALAGRFRSTLTDGSALSSFYSMLASQGVDLTDGLPLAPYSPQIEIKSTLSGAIVAVDAVGIGLALAELGANRVRATDSIFHDVGLDVAVHVGDVVAAGDVIATLCFNEKSKIRLGERAVLAAQKMAQLWHIA